MEKNGAVSVPIIRIYVALNNIPWLSLSYLFPLTTEKSQLCKYRMQYLAQRGDYATVSSLSLLPYQDDPVIRLLE